jgi:SAM-dependent methyltransferase
MPPTTTPPFPDPAASGRIWFGAGVDGESELRVCGELAGRRVVELGIAPVPATAVPNAILAAQAGAKSIAVDPSGDRIGTLRRLAEGAEMRVECHTADLADLGFATSASVDLVLAVHTLGQVDDLPRVFRQVHRLLKPAAAFVIVMPHPVAAMFDAPPATSGMPDDRGPSRRYGDPGPSFGELYLTAMRANFTLDAVHELFPHAMPDARVPTTLVVRARKQGV